MRKRCEICSKLTIKHTFSSVFIVDFEQEKVSWGNIPNTNQEKINSLPNDVDVVTWSNGHKYRVFVFPRR